MDSSVKNRILEYRKAAKEQMEIIKSGEDMCPEELYEHLFIYVKRKYLLDDEDCAGDAFSELIETSIAKSQRIAKNLVTDTDTPAGCDGTSSAVTKKVLLLMAVQKELGIKFPPEKSPAIKTIRDLADITYSLMRS